MRENFPFSCCVIVLIFGKVKGSSHIEDAKIMSNYCYKLISNFFPKKILSAEENVEDINLSAMSLDSAWGF